MYIYFNMHVFTSFLHGQQVEETGEDGIHIPEHEVITRRRQFRMKKERTDKKKSDRED